MLHKNCNKNYKNNSNQAETAKLTLHMLNHTLMNFLVVSVELCGVATVMTREVINKFVLNLYFYNISFIFISLYFLSPKLNKILLNYYFSIFPFENTLFSFTPLLFH